MPADPQPRTLSRNGIQKGHSSVIERTIDCDSGRMLHFYDTSGPDASTRLAVFWLHGTPSIGAPPEPLFATSDGLGIRWVSYDRPGYGGSTPHAGRILSSCANDIACIADVLGIETFALVGYSGGASHALACAATLAARIRGVVSLGALAPIDAQGLDWLAGMVPSGVASLSAALAGREARLRHEQSGAEYDPDFTSSDLEVLASEWAWLRTVTQHGMDAGPYGLVDDDLAYVAPWGCNAAAITAPVLLVQGGRDRIVPSSHSDWLVRVIPGAQLWHTAGDGHVSVLSHAKEALVWLSERRLATPGRDLAW
jgi:pimeloyl-ACP methyl ester carboxylesterase